MFGPPRVHAMHMTAGSYQHKRSTRPRRGLNYLRTWIVYKYKKQLSAPLPTGASLGVLCCEWVPMHIKVRLFIVTEPLVAHPKLLKNGHRALGLPLLHLIVTRHTRAPRHVPPKAKASLVAILGTTSSTSHVDEIAGV